MHARFAALAVAVLLVGPGCGAPDPIVDVTTVQLHVPRAEECGAPMPLPLRIEALGDFPTTGRSVLLVTEERATMPARFDPLPEETRAFMVSSSHADWEAAGIVFVGEGAARRDLLLAPLGRTCPLCDALSPCTGVDDSSSLELEEGAVASALPDGSAVTIGGLDESRRAVRRMVVLAPGTQAGEALGPEASLGTEALDDARAWASAVVTRDRLIVSGGAFDECSLAHSSYESFLIHAGERPLLVREDPTDDTLVRPRVDHASAALPTGEVLLVGGREHHVDCRTDDMVDDAAPLSSVEIIDRNGTASELEGGLVRARANPELLVLDDGTVLVVGGVEADGDLVRSIEAFSPVTEVLTPIEAPTLAAYDGAFAVPLPGARLAWIGTFMGELRAQLVMRVPPYLGVALQTEEILLDGCGVGPFDSLRGAPLPDGTILLTAAGTACIVDPGRGISFAVDAGAAGDRGFTPARLLPLADGTTLALASGGAAIRRDLAITSFDAPPATLIEEELAFDGPSRWTRSADGATARVDDARLDVPTLRFADVEVELEANGGLAELLLLPDRAPPVPIALFPAMAECVGTRGVARVDAAPLRVVRRGDSVTLSAGGESARCTLPALTARIGIAVRATGGTTFRALRIRRL